MLNERKNKSNRVIDYSGSDSRKDIQAVRNSHTEQEKTVRHRIARIHLLHYAILLCPLEAARQRTRGRTAHCWLSPVCSLIRELMLSINGLTELIIHWTWVMHSCPFYYQKFKSYSISLVTRVRSNLFKIRSLLQHLCNKHFVIYYSLGSGWIPCWTSIWLNIIATL